MSKTELTNGLKQAIRQWTDKHLQVNLKFWLEGRKSESWMMSELSIACWMEFRESLNLSTTPLVKDGAKVGEVVEDLKQIQSQMFKVLDANQFTLIQSGWEVPVRTLMHREPVKLEDKYVPHVARRPDLTVSDEQAAAMQHLTNTPWVVNKPVWDKMVEFRKGLSDEDQNKIFYDYESDEIEALGSHEELSDDESSTLFDSISHEGTFYLVTRRIDESGRMFPDPCHPVYSRWLRAAFTMPSEKLTEEGWSFFRKHITEAYGPSTDKARDTWAARVISHPKLDLESKKVAGELSAAHSWQEARETGATGYACSRDFVAQGMGIIAAKMNCDWHHQLVDVNNPKFLSAHDRFSVRLQDQIRNFSVHRLDDLKATSKNVITPGMYGGGGSAITAKLTEMTTSVHGGWNFGENDVKMPKLDPIIADYIKVTDRDEVMSAVMKLSKKLKKVLDSTFPFLAPFQSQVRSEWKGHMENGTVPVYQGADGHQVLASPFKVNKKLTTSIRTSFWDEGVRHQPSVAVWHHMLEESGTPWCAKTIFMLDRLIAVRIILMLAELGIYVLSIHDAFSVHPNYGYILERIATKAYNEVMSEHADICGTIYRPLPADAVLLRA